MNIIETRQLGIEFERRVQTMIPETEFYRKLDTETIYSFLNQYLDKYIHDIYRNLDKILADSKLSAHIDRVLQELLVTESITENLYIDNNLSITDSNDVKIIDTARSITYTLPENFYLYVRSVSRVKKTFAFKSGNNNTATRIVPNILTSLNDIWKVIETPHDSLRILRYPVAVLNTYKNSTQTIYKGTDAFGNKVFQEIVVGKNPTLTVIYDRYTEPDGISITYYKQPAHFSLFTNTPCELPIDAFDDLVTGAVDLYVQYAAGAEARRKQQLDEAQKRAREDQRDARRNAANQD